MPAAPASSPAPERRLPRGRHNLSREEVAAAQRLRILEALAEVMTAKGYAATSVADILVAAGVSRETFYEQFSSKQHCFEVAFESAAAQLLEALAPLLSSGGPAIERFDRLLAAYLRALADNPARARLFLIEVYAAGPAVHDRRVRVQRQMVDAVAALLGASTAEGRFACEALVAAVSSMVTARLAAGDTQGLLALRAPFSALVHAATP